MAGVVPCRCRYHVDYRRTRLSVGLLSLYGVGDQPHDREWEASEIYWNWVGIIQKIHRMVPLDVRDIGNLWILDVDQGQEMDRRAYRIRVPVHGLPAGPSCPATG